MSNNKYSRYNSINDIIQSEVSGVVIKGSGYFIRDSKKLQGTIPALLMVDCVYVGSFQGLIQSTIGSITGQKGKAASIYGSRGDIAEQLLLRP
jgi:hypothetical protein